MGVNISAEHVAPDVEPLPLDDYVPHAADVGGVGGPQLQPPGVGVRTQEERVVGVRGTNARHT